MDQDIKIYYLPAYRSVIVGIILLLMGIAFTFGLVDYNQSFWSIFQMLFLSFESVGNFLFSLIMLLFKAGFILGGCMYIKYFNGVERAKLDKKGFYYREIPKGTKYDKLATDLNKMTFIPYKDIVDITCEKKFFAGRQLFLTLSAGKIKLTTLGVLKHSEKDEIIKLVKQRIIYA